MALTVVDGWLYAEGVRSHFALRREDVCNLWTRSDQQGGLVLSDGSQVRLSGIDDVARIVLERWWQAKAPGDGEPTFPPTRVHERELARQGAWTLLPSLAFPMMAAARLLASDWRAYGSALAMIFGFFVIALALTTRRFIGLVQTDDRAKEEQKSLAGRTPPLQVASEEAKVRIG